jgi:hypothetical protein
MIIRMTKMAILPPRQVLLWNSGGWINSYKYELTYNMAQQIILHMDYEWNFGANQWDNMNKNEYFYTSSILTSEIASYWNYGINNWEYNAKSEYFYETMAVTKEIVYRWETNPSAVWVEESKYEYEYEPGSVWRYWSEQMKQIILGMKVLMVGIGNLSIRPTINMTIEII